MFKLNASVKSVRCNLIWKFRKKKKKSLIYLCRSSNKMQYLTIIAYPTRSNDQMLINKHD